MYQTTLQAAPVRRSEPGSDSSRSSEDRQAEQLLASFAGAGASLYVRGIENQVNRLLRLIVESEDRTSRNVVVDLTEQQVRATA